MEDWFNAAPQSRIGMAAGFFRCRYINGLEVGADFFQVFPGNELRGKN
jgi:hypothetical protein